MHQTLRRNHAGVSIGSQCVAGAIGVGIQLLRSYLHCLFVKASLFCCLRGLNDTSSLTSSDMKVAGLLVETWLLLKLCRHVFISCSVDSQIPGLLTAFRLTLTALVHI
jgi:hypothetical protein